MNEGLGKNDGGMGKQISNEERGRKWKKKCQETEGKKQQRHRKQKRNEAKDGNKRQKRKGRKEKKRKERKITDQHWIRYHFDSRCFRNSSCRFLSLRISFFPRLDSVPGKSPASESDSRLSARLFGVFPEKSRIWSNGRAFIPSGVKILRRSRKRLCWTAVWIGVRPSASRRVRLIPWVRRSLVIGKLSFATAV